MATGFVNKIISSTMVEDTKGDTQTTHTTNIYNPNSMSIITSPSTSYTTRASKTITVEKDNSVVVLVGYSSYMNDSGLTRTASAKILDVSTEVVPEDTATLLDNQIEIVSCYAIVTGVSSGSHTYNYQTKVDATGSQIGLTASGIIVNVVQI